MSLTTPAEANLQFGEWAYVPLGHSKKPPYTPHTSIIRKGLGKLPFGGWGYHPQTLTHPAK